MTEKRSCQQTDLEKIVAVRQIFSRITPTYDRLNRIMSAGRDVAWRRFLVRHIQPEARVVLDVATGTGDVALEIIRQRPEIKVVGIDFVKEMLDLAITKTRKRGFSGKIDYLKADALHLPFPDQCFDAATLAFGMRNIPDRLGVLRELARVVRPGGKVLILEMTFPRNLGLHRFFHWYLNAVIPKLGRLIAGNQAAYSYLSESIQNFVHPDQLEKLLGEVGLGEIKIFRLTFGITYLHEGRVP